MSLTSQMLQKVIGKRFDVFCPLAKRRKRNLNTIHTI